MSAAPMTTDVIAVFETFADSVRPQLLNLRELVFETAAQTKAAGEIVETLKWGQPSYLTVRPKSGSTIRLGVAKSGQPALFCHCQTSLISDFRDIYPRTFDFEGNRALVLKEGETIPKVELAHCIALALTYHSRKRA